MDPMIEFVKKHPTPSLVLSIGATYLTYYLLVAAKKPQLVGNRHFVEFLLRRCPMVHERYWPTFWCIEAKAMTIMRTLLKTKTFVPYRKEFLDLADGGHVALDWTEADSKTASPGPESKTLPLVLILPGLTGSSDESYARHFALQTIQLGYRAVVFNNRGNGGAELKTSRTYNARNTDDLREVIGYIQKTHPQAPLMAVGISLGGLILTNYLFEIEDKSPLLAAMVVSSPFDVFESNSNLERPFNKLLTRHLATNLTKSLKQNHDVFADSDLFDLDHVYKSKTIKDFDSRFTSRQFGYRSYMEYYADSCIHSKLDQIQTPLLFLASADDPFSPGKAIPVDLAQKSSSVAMVITARGGHIGFLEGFIPTTTSYMDRMFAGYVQAVFQYHDELVDGGH